MRFFTLVPTLFAAGSIALVPLAHNKEADTSAIKAYEKYAEIESENAPATEARWDHGHIKARTTLLQGINNALDDLGLSLKSTIGQVVSALGLSAVDDDIDSLLSGLVNDVDKLTNKLEAAVNGLLDDLGLVVVDDTIADLEKALGLKSKNTIGQLLHKLGVL